MTQPPEQIVETWYQRLKSKARGNIAGGLVLLENLQGNFSLDISDHKANKSDQLKNAGGANLDKILGKFGETRKFLQEGGRTNRGLMKNMSLLLDELKEAGFQEFSAEERNTMLYQMQEFLAVKATTMLNAEKLTFDYNATTISREIFKNILESAFKRGKAGEVAEYLVGAKLALRFPQRDIRNTSASAADDQAGESGDFQIHDCVFHVTMAPNRGHYEKCLTNFSNGLRVFLLVPDSKLTGARQYIDSDLQNCVSVESIESFVSQNIEELSEFSGKKIADKFAALLEKYNERVTEVETDLSLQIEIPTALSRRKT